MWKEPLTQAGNLFLFIEQFNCLGWKRPLTSSGRWVGDIKNLEVLKTLCTEQVEHEELQAPPSPAALCQYSSPWTWPPQKAKAGVHSLSSLQSLLASVLRLLSWVSICAVKKISVRFQNPFTNELFHLCEWDKGILCLKIRIFFSCCSAHFLHLFTSFFFSENITR